METLQQIRDVFIGECSNLSRVVRFYQTTTSKIPSDPGVRKFIEAFKKNIETTPDLVERTIQAQMIGEWRIFLVRIFERFVYEVLSERKLHKINFKAQLCFPQDLDSNLVDIIQNRAVHDFDKQDYDTQLDIVLRLLGKPVDKSHENIRFINKHKVIRDVIQHNKGKLRDRDFRILGIQKISLLNGPTKKDTIYKTGDVVILTYWEIIELSKILGKTAKILVKSSV